MARRLSLPDFSDVAVARTTGSADSGADAGADAADALAGVGGAGAVEFPREVHADGRSGGLHLSEVLALLLGLEVVGDGHKVDGDFVFVGLVVGDGFQQFHQVARLVVETDVGVGDRDPLCPR